MAKITTVDLKVNNESFVRKKSGKINMEYKLQGGLGKGGFGEVRKAVHKQSGIKRAVKLIKKVDLDEEEKERLINEVELLKKLVSQKKESLTELKSF